MYDAPVSDDQFHADVVLFGGNGTVDQLKIVAQPDQVSFSSGMQQKSVVIPLAVADAVSVGIKRNTRNDNQVRLVGMVVDTGRTWFQNTKAPFGQALQPFDLPEHHPLSADGRIKNPLAGGKSCLKYPGSVDLVVGRRIQSNALCPRKLLQGNKLPLCRPAGREPLFVTECPAPRKNLLAK